MAEITWIKLKTDMFENDKIKLIEALPDADTIIVIWIKLLASAGKANTNGYIMLTESIPMNIEEMSTIFGRPLNTVRLAIQTFKRYGMIEIDENDVIRIKNWENHQNIDGMERVREQNRLRKQKQRAKEKQLQIGHAMSRDSHATEREEDIDIDKEIDKEKEEEKEKSSRQSSPSSLIDVRFVKIRTYFDENIRTSTFAEHRKIDELLKFYPDPQLFIEAIRIANENGKANFKYIEGILRNWKTEKGITTYEHYLKKEAKNDAKSKGNSPKRQRTAESEFGVKLDF
ncbi:putative phage replisome organizer [Lysinibacillus composti]|uniref:DnaD domain protein n=1 Tax=Lysinibacillus composti TaxID=720633 RepID=A0A3N9UIS1_9BACI|nr:phage replisome organizer N-terminal domain-containing protein [Lysinibacillus composti]MBM7607545.1 putative phage replisome organizer [Lysinibacillus composti]RQW75949.1 DnaD domain protein [Lysinibacillus composti]